MGRIDHDVLPPRDVSAVHIHAEDPAWLRLERRRTAPTSKQIGIGEERKDRLGPRSYANLAGDRARLSGGHRLRPFSACLSTVRCWEIAGRVTSKREAISPALSSLELTSSRILRRLGSAMARSMASINQL